MSLAQAIDTGDLAQLPSRRDEDWKWTDLRGLIRVLPPPSPDSLPPASESPFAGLVEHEVMIVNGRGQGEVVVGQGESRTIALRLVSAANAGSHAARLSIAVEDGAHLTLLETYEGYSPDYVVETDLTFNLGVGATLERCVLAKDAPGAVSVSKARIVMSPGSKLAQTVITSGARRQRIETRVEHPGGGASVRLDGIYLLAMQRHADITTAVIHDGVDGVTDQLIKGVVRDQGRGVFQGRIVVSRGADRTDAKMGHHALLLSDRAEVDAKPELEIYADDVACAHGNTVGALDEDALFYATARGIPETQARAMLTEAFVGEVVERIGHDGARERIGAFVAGQLSAGA